MFFSKDVPDLNKRGVVTINISAEFWDGESFGPLGVNIVDYTNIDQKVLEDSIGSINLGLRMIEKMAHDKLFDEAKEDLDK